MIAQTLSEKILSAHSGREVRAGDVAVCPVDGALATDASFPMAIDYFESMAGERVLHPETLAVALDHYAPGHASHQRTRDFARRHGIHVWEAGQGIGHQLMVESGRIQPGTLFAGADSHSVTYGALNAFATGIGSSDFAAIMICGRVWLRVPRSIRVELRGSLPPGVYAKDVVLALARELGADGADYQTLEFHGDLPLDDRLVLSNMSVELGAKAGIFAGPLRPDPGASYAREIQLDLAGIAPQVALPHQVDRVIPIRGAANMLVQMVYIGTCTGGRVSDFHAALEILKAAGGPAPGVRLVIAPASQAVLDALQTDGTLAGFLEMGAEVGSPGCGACCGTCGAIPPDGVNVVSSANRNFKGRMGNVNANIFLASPAACAASAASGFISDPRKWTRS